MNRLVKNNFYILASWGGGGGGGKKPLNLCSPLYSVYNIKENVEPDSLHSKSTSKYLYIPGQGSPNVVPSAVS